MNKVTILDMRVNITSKEQSIGYIEEWLQESWENRQGKSVCLSNVHMCMEVKDCDNYKEIVNNSDLVLPDGKPLSLAQKSYGFNEAQQVRGTDITLELCKLSHDKNYSVGFYGASQETLNALEKKLKDLFPKINIQLLESPPYRELTQEEDENYINLINSKKIDILFVGLGCPKQEKWMAEHRDKIKSVMLGVGAAFDFISGNKSHAPKFMQKAGMEWLHRLSCEPKRLFVRYMKQNPRFVFNFAKQYFPKKRSLAQLQKRKMLKR